MPNITLAFFPTVWVRQLEEIIKSEERVEKQIARITKIIPTGTQVIFCSRPKCSTGYFQQWGSLIIAST